MIRARYTMALSRSPIIRQVVLKQSLSSSTPPLKHIKPSAIELIKYFPTGMKLLFKNIQQYYNITAASQSPNNKWTTQGGINYIPRRQSEQQRQLIRDVWKVAFPVSYINLPILGNTIWILIAWKPNLFLSKQFFEFQYHRSFVSEEYRERRGAFSKVANDFWRTVMMDEQSSETKELLQINTDVGDDAGVILDGVALHELFRRGSGRGNIQWDSIPRQQLVQIAAVSGMSSFISMVMPRSIVQVRLQAKVKDIVLDDANLLREKHHLVNNERLTDEEVMDACALRGLPCHLGQSFDSMRTCLTNYLFIMEAVHQNIGKDRLIKDEEGIMFVLHLQPIRFQLNKGSI